MKLHPAYYFRPLAQPLVLSKEYGILLRPPAESELGLWKQNTFNIFGVLSDKEKRRILYTLYPLGLPKASGALDEIFTEVLASLWLGAEFSKPFFLEPAEYGALCGIPHKGGWLRSPPSFLAGSFGERRVFLRALKYDLSTCASLLQKPESLSALDGLLNFTSSLDGLLAQESLRGFLKKLAGVLASEASSQEAAFLQQALAAELLTVNEGSSRSKQFARKLALIRYLMLKEKGEQPMLSPKHTEDIFARCYRTRSELVHGGRAPSGKALREKTHILFTTVRLALQLMAADPHLFFYIKEG